MFSLSERHNRQDGYCDDDSDCDDDEACTSGQCLNACTLGVCGENTVCIAKNHRALCSCLLGYLGLPEIFCSLAPGILSLYFRLSF